MAEASSPYSAPSPASPITELVKPTPVQFAPTQVAKPYTAVFFFFFFFITLGLELSDTKVYEP